MKVVRVIATLAAIAMLALAAAIFVITPESWTACHVDHVADACFEAMDRPANGELVWTGYVTAFTLCLAAFALSLPSASPVRSRPTIAALAVLFVASPILDFGVVAGIWNGHGDWDTPPDHGYLTATGIALAGALVLWAATRAVSPRPATDRSDPVLPGSTSASGSETASPSVPRR